MSTYEFYYDETEHSRKINYNTVSASNYYDNFVTMIVGWSSEKNEILQRYAAFEDMFIVKRRIYQGVNQGVGIEDVVIEVYLT